MTAAPDPLRPAESTAPRDTPGTAYRQQWKIVALFVGIVMLQLALGVISVDVMSSVRAYVGGESLWSKGQKEAWYWSTRYGETHAEEDYRRFRVALDIPLGDRIAREELDKPDADLDVAASGFVQGANDPGDVGGMIRLYRGFHGIPFMADAIAIWARGDQGIATLSALVERAHARIENGEPGAQEVRALSERLPALNDELTRLERQFSARLGEASRKTRWLLVGVNSAMAVLMILAGLTFARALIREQARAERALRASTERWELAAGIAGLGLFDWGMSQRTITLDARACALHGIDTPEPRTLDIRQAAAMVHPEDEPRMREAIAEAVAGGRPLVLRYRVFRRDGTLRHLELTGLASQRAGTRDRRMSGILRDITDDMQAEQLRLDRLAAERASRAKSEFLARVSHELRTPLNAILGFGELMQVDQVDRLTPSQAQRVQHMVQGGQYLLRLVDDILNLTAMETGRTRFEVRDLSVAALVDACASLVTSLAATHDVRVDVRAPPAEVVARGDPVRAKLVLVILLTTAVKYNRRGGRVTVSWQAEGEDVRISVLDTGPGMSPEQVAQLFQPFNRLGAEYSRVAGTGLGLVIARETLQQMGGAIEVNSQPGVGSCFTVRLPLASTTQAAIEDES